MCQRSRRRGCAWTVPATSAYVGSCALRITAVCSEDGRVTALMPHAERSIHGVTGSWGPQTWSGNTPWFRMFENARSWVG